MNELALSFVERINSLHADNRELDNSLRFTFLRKLNQTRECGLLIEEARKTLGTKGWAAVQAELQLGDEPAKVIKTYTTFAQKNPVQITDINEGMKALDDALMVTGFLPFPETHGPQTPHPVSFFSWSAKAFTTLNAEFEKKFAADPPDNWTPNAAEQWVAQFEPTVERINEALAQAKRRALLVAA